MALNVKFLKGTADGYAAIVTKDANTFYYTGTDLYLGEVKLSNGADLADALIRLGTAETDIDNLEKAVGELSGLDTTAKTDLVSAINEVLGKISDAQEADKISLEIAGTATEGFLKTYVIKQGAAKVGKIDIPKDLVVTEGSVVVDPDGQPKGTYIKLIIANQEAPIYINVKDLVDVYTAQASAPQIQLAISANKEISASVVAGSITDTELAANAVTTAKIADANVTKAKLEASLQSAIDKANSAIQKIETGTANGSIAVDGADVQVKGLGSAAYKSDTAFDEAGAAAAVLGESGDLASANTVYGAKKYADSLADNYDAAGTADAAIQALDSTATQTASASNGQVAITVTQEDGKITGVTASVKENTYDSYGSASTAETNAKAYTDNALTWGSF